MSFTNNARVGAELAAMELESRVPACSEDELLAERQSTRRSLVFSAGVVVACALAASVVLSLLSYWIKVSAPHYPIARGVAGFAAVLAALSPGVYLIFLLRDAPAVKRMTAAAIVLLIVSQFLDFAWQIPYIEGWAIFGATHEVRRAVRWAVYLVGFILLLASYYYALFVAIRAEERLQRERLALIREAKRRKDLAGALSEQDIVYRTAIAQAGAIPYRVDRIARAYKFYDNEFYRLTGFDPDELTYDRIEQMPEDVRYVGPLAGMPAATVESLIKSGAIRKWHREYRVRTKSGKVKWIGDSSVVLDSPDGKTPETVGLMVDITDRHIEKEEILRKERHFRSLIENGQDLITVLNLDGTVRYVSPSAERIMGQNPDELIGTAGLDQMHPDDLGRALELLREAFSNPGKSYRFEYRARHADGTWRTLESIGRVIVGDGDINGAIINSRDITDRKTLEAQFIQLQKLEGIGRLAGGVAHDFNNMLTAIMGYCEFALDELSEGDALRGQIEQVMAASSRAADLTRQLLAFARKQIAEPENVDLSQLVQNMVKLFQRLIGEDIQLTMNTMPEPSVAYLDPGQIEQVLVNLVVNARDAMPRGGNLAIEVRNIYLDESYAEHHQDVTPGDYVMIAVSDTGIGMSENVRARIFEPFFTTKGNEKGTGLGLATSYGVVKQARGHIWVYSEVDRGSTFKVYLPRTHAEATTRCPQKKAVPARGGVESILIVEDEPLVRAIAVQTLTQRGYRVFDAPSGPCALTFTDGFAGKIDLLITDLVMPRMSGRELADCLTKKRGPTKVLYMSGYTEDAIVQHGEIVPGIDFLSKPFTPESLARKVRAVLDQEKEPGLASA